MNLDYNIPEKVYKHFSEFVTSEYLDEVWSRLIKAFMEEKTLPTIIIISESPNSEMMNKFIFTMCELGYLESRIDAGYAQCYLNKDKLKSILQLSDEDILDLRGNYKYHKYLLRCTHSDTVDVSKVNGHRTKVGLVREGFQKASNHIYRYDIRYIEKYLPYITRHLWKGLSSSLKDVPYQTVIECVVKYSKLAYADYTLEECLTDSRGRAIFQCCKRIFNPIASKDARALIICPVRELSLDGEKYVYAFIAELNGILGKNFEDKVEQGLKCYQDRRLPSLETMKATKDYDSLHERIWLERLYENLDNLSKFNRSWVVPIELDARASACEMIAVLTNNHLYMDETNLINPDNFKDFWTIEGIPRKLVKKAATPLIYGSSAKPKELWDLHQLPYTQEQVSKMNHEIAHGKLSYAEEFKNYIINNSKPKEVNEVLIHNDKFLVYCNRFLDDPDSLEKYKIWNSKSKKFTLLFRKNRTIPDLERFKTFFMTCLCHNLDSQLSNYLCTKLDWVIPIHDAWNIHPNDAVLLGKEFTRKMYEIYEYRRTILHGYFHSLGIPYQDMDVDTEEISEFSPYALK